MAILMTDYGPDWDRIWTTIIQSSGEVWDFKNSDVRAVKNLTTHTNLTGNTPGEIVAHSSLAPAGNVHEDRKK